MWYEHETKKMVLQKKKKIGASTMDKQSSKNLGREKLFKMRIQGIEPWSVPWEGTMIPLHQMRFTLNGSHKIFKDYNKLWKAGQPIIS